VLCDDDEVLGMAYGLNIIGNKHIVKAECMAIGFSNIQRSDKITKQIPKFKYLG